MLNYLLDEPIKGKFYLPKIQKVMPHEHFTTDRILKTRHGVDCKIACYITWLVYMSKFNSWIDEVRTID